MKPVFVIMVTYRRFVYFKQTLESLVPTLPDGSQILIVDNYSDQMEYERWWIEAIETHWFEKFGKKITAQILLLNKNIGWGAAVNDGLRTHAQWKDFEYVLESNNDVLYATDWCSKAQDLMNKNENVGVLGLWKHINHGENRRTDDLVYKDDMPAVAWLMRSRDLEKFLPFEEKGATKKRGGIGEDSAFTTKVKSMGYDIAAPINDLAHHMDGYDNMGGDENPAYL